MPAFGGRLCVVGRGGVGGWRWEGWHVAGIRDGCDRDQAGAGEYRPVWRAVPGADLYGGGDRLLHAKKEERGGELCGTICGEGGRGKGSGDRDQSRGDLEGV